MKRVNEEKYAVVARDIPIGLDAESYMQGAVMVLEMLDKEQDIVTCGDCKWYDSAFYVCSKCGVCVNRDFFCADGEKDKDTKGE